MKPVLVRTWEGTWWQRVVTAAMLAALLVAGYGIFRSTGDEDEPNERSRRAYDLIEGRPLFDCDDGPDACNELLTQLATIAAEND